MLFERASRVVDLWVREGLKNVRFSGGEPTLYKRLLDLVAQAREGGVERIAISTNGSNSPKTYEKLMQVGVNDFSISLDGGCCSTGEKMAGDKPGTWDRVVRNIERISKEVYCSVGMVFTEDNVDECVEAVKFADSLGVSDIRVIPSAQYNRALMKLASLPHAFLDKYPILKYRIANIREGLHVRGIPSGNRDRCRLAIDDMAIAKNWHFPCIIYLREGGDPVGKIGENMRKERLQWLQKHEPWNDPICKKNCLDVCVEYNRKAAK
jgi:MoaA/NifB/PqqE/SkfB family radical SAM enzyme